MFVRLCTLSDMAEIKAQLEAFYAECGFLDPDRPKAFRSVEEIVADGRCFFLCEDGGKIIGSLAIEMYSPWWSTEKRMQDRWLYIYPGDRNTKAFKTLLDIAVFLAKSNEAALYIQLNTLGADRKQVLFKRYMEECAQVYEIKYVGGVFRPGTK